MVLVVGLDVGGLELEGLAVGVGPSLLDNQQHLVVVIVLFDGSNTPLNYTKRQNELYIDVG